MRSERLWVRKFIRIGFRLGFNKTWRSRWFADRDYAKLLHEDLRLRETLKARFQHAGVSKIEIERAANKLKIDIHTSRPGIIIGRKGTEVDKLKQEIQKRTSREVFINIQEIQKPELDAQLISESVAMQLEKRVAFRRAMRKAVESALRFGARGIKVRVSGRLNGAEIARSEWYLHGQLPLQTLRADIDYGSGGGGHDLRPDRREGVALQGRASRAADGREEEYRTPRRAARCTAYRRGGISHVDAEEGQVPEAAARPAARQGLARVRRVVRRLRAARRMEPCWMTARQIEAARVAMTRFIKRGGKIWIRVFPDKPITEEAAGNAHGQGQGRARSSGSRVVRPGKVLFEMEGRHRGRGARGHAICAAAKLPIKTKFAMRFAEEKACDEGRRRSAS